MWDTRHHVEHSTQLRGATRQSYRIPLLTRTYLLCLAVTELACPLTGQGCTSDASDRAAACLWLCRLNSVELPRRMPYTEY